MGVNFVVLIGAGDCLVGFAGAGHGLVGSVGAGDGLVGLTPWTVLVPVDILPLTPLVGDCATLYHRPVARAGVVLAGVALVVVALDDIVLVLPLVYLRMYAF